MRNSPGKRRLALVIGGLVGLGLIALVLARGPGSQPTTDRVLRVAFDSEIPTMDPAVGENERSLAVERLVFEQLLGYDRGTGLVPLLAEQLPTVSPDGLTYSFRLRAGVNFVRPDGSMVREMVADDVVGSFARLLDPDLRPTPFPEAGVLFTMIEGANDVVAGAVDRPTGIRALDRRTVEFRLREPDATFPYRLATAFASIVPAEVAGLNTDAFSRAPVGTGPFLLRSTVTGSRMSFVRNPSYWRPADQRVEGVEVSLGVDPAVAVERVQAGELDIAGSGIPPGMFGQVVDDPRWSSRVHLRTLMETQYLAMDTQSTSPLGDVRVRQAIAHVIDRNNIITIVQGRGEVARCIYPPQLTAYDPACDPYPFDVDRARELMREAGQGAGFETRIFVVAEDPDPLIGESFQADLAGINIRAEVVAQPFATWLKSISTPDRAPTSYPGWNVDYPDPANFVEPILTCATVIPNGGNYARYCNPDVDRLAAEARRERDPEERVARYREVQRLIMADAPWVPIRHPVRATIVSGRVTDFYFHPIWAYDLRGYAVGD
jgi:ABC-type transport system substrate-binding protein